jgi:SCY1-like protein 2
VSNIVKDQVRVNALLCLGEVVPRLDKPAVLEVLQTLQRCTAVDHSAPTLMCTLGVASAIFKQLGTEFAAEHLLPLLCPLLIAQQLNLQQFAKYMHFVKEVIRKIEEKRGVIVNEAEPVSLDVKSMALSDPAKENVSATSNSTKTNSWDSDWDVSKGKTKTAGGGATIVPSKAPSQIPSLSTAPTTSPVVPSLTTMDTSQQQLSSLSFEWPPAAPLAAVQAPNLQPGNAIVSTGNATQASQHTSIDFGKSSFGSGMLNQSSTNTGLNGGFGSVSMEATAVQAGEDDFDPFADWPPRSGSAAKNTVAVGGISRHASWGGGLGASNNSMLKTSNPPLSMSDWSIPSAAPSTPQAAPRNVEDFFVSPKAQDSNPLKLAPPPPSGLGLGKGRGRNPMRPLRSSKANNQTSGRSDQPPLLDLL